MREGDEGRRTGRSIVERTLSVIFIQQDLHLKGRDKPTGTGWKGATTRACAREWRYWGRPSTTPAIKWTKNGRAGGGRGQHHQHQDSIKTGVDDGHHDLRNILFSASSGGELYSFGYVSRFFVERHSTNACASSAALVLLVGCGTPCNIRSVVYCACHRRLEKRHGDFR